MSARLAILCWHNVDSSWCFPFPPHIGPRAFDRQLRFLKRLGNVVPLPGALNALTAGRPLPARAVSITFDDGYRDNLRFAVPLLEHHRLPATYFLVPGLLSRIVRPWWEVAAWAFMCAREQQLNWEGQSLKLDTVALRRASFRGVAARLKRRNRMARDAEVATLVDRLRPSGNPTVEELFLDWNEARLLVQRGFSVGSHSMYHTILSRESPAEQTFDLGESRRRLQEELGAEVGLLAYPNGTRQDYGPETITAARQAGYSYALTTLQGRNRLSTPPYELRRLVLSPMAGLHPIASGIRWVTQRARR